MHFDDTFCIHDVFRGLGDDLFRIGQLYNDECSVDFGVSLNDLISTELTARGYLSAGCSHPVTIYSGEGKDTYDVLHNKCNLELDGGSGDDLFIVRSFIQVAVDGSIEDLQRGNTTIRGGDGVDEFYIASHEDPTEDMPSYISNNFVDVDGGECSIFFAI